MDRRKLLHDLGERVKELRVLHRTAMLLGDDETDPDAVLRQVLPVLANALQFPADTAARIVFGQREWTTDNFRPTDSPLRAAFQCGQEEGFVEIVYLRAPAGRDPFLPEEHELMASLAEMLRAWFDRRSAKEALVASETRLRTIIESEPEAVTVVSLEGKLLDMNPAGLRMIGAKQISEVAGKPVTDLVHPDDRVAYTRLHRRAGRGESGQLSFRLGGPGGGDRLIETHAAPLQKPDGSVTAVLSVMRDITARTRAETALTAARRRTELILASVGEGIHGLDAHGRIIFENPAGAAILGWQEEELIGQHSHSLIHHHRADGTAYPVEACPINRTLRDGRVRRVDNDVFFRKDGRSFPVEFVCSPVMDEAGTITGAVVCFRDVTERKMTEKHLGAFATLGRRLGAAVTAEKAARVIADAADDLFGWDACTLRLYDRERDWSRAVLAIDTMDGERRDTAPAIAEGPPMPIVRDVIEGGSKLILREEPLRMSGDLTPFGDTERPSASLMIVPVRYRNDVIAVLSVQSYTHNAFRRNDLAALEALADHCGGALARVRAHDALHESRRELLTLMSNLPGMAYRCRNDRNRTIEFISEGASSHTGYMPGDLTGNARVQFSDLIHPDDRQTTWKLIQEAIAEDRPFELVYRIRTADGVEKWMWERGRAIRNTGGSVMALEGFISDITAQKRAQEKIRLSEERFRLLSKAANDAIWDWNLTSGVLWWNEGFEALFGLKMEEADTTIQSWEKRIHPEDREAVAGEVKNAVASGAEYWSGEYRFRREDGTYAHVMDRGYVIRDTAGKAVRMIGGMTDITERKQMTQQLLRAQRMESIGTLAGGIAHDLNNVLAPILMATEMLQEKVGDEEARGMLATVRSSAQRGADLVQQVLGFARGIEGKHAAVDVGHLLRDLRVFIRETFPKNVDFDVNIPGEVWAVDGDATQLHQVLMNLCVNARDAMPDGGRLTVTLRNTVLDEAYAAMNPDAKPGSYVVIEVDDTGCGMPKAIRERIFDPFFTTKEVGKGTGLGLSTVLTITRSHGGFINVYSERGKGTQFKVYLPARTTSAPAEHTATGPTQLPPGRGETVLVVDDEEAIRTITRKTLERFGYRVLLARHGAEAVALYAQRQKEIAVVLTDMAMPVLDGPGTIVALKAIDPDVKIIGSSGMAANAMLTQAVGAGVRHFVPKPYTAETLLRTLREVISSESPVSPAPPRPGFDGNAGALIPPGAPAALPTPPIDGRSGPTPLQSP